MEGNSSVEPVPVGPLPYAREYNMNHRRRGKAIIFSHYEYHNDREKKREGTHRDENSLYKVLSDLDFEVVKIERDRTVEGIMRELRNVAKENHSDVDCLVVVILSHGRESSEDENEVDEAKQQSKSLKIKSSKKTYEVQAWDEFYDELELFTPFYGKNCSTLRGKPKLFFIQACRGIKEQPMSQLEYYRAHNDGSSDKKLLYRIPDVADFLIYRSTFNGNLSDRHKKEGTLFIQTLCHALEENRTNGSVDDLNTLLSFVNGRVAIKGQMPFIVHTLTKLVYFRPKPTICDQENKTDEFESCMDF